MPRPSNIHVIANSQSFNAFVKEGEVSNEYKDKLVRDLLLARRWLSC